MCYCLHVSYLCRICCCCCCYVPSVNSLRLYSEDMKQMRCAGVCGVCVVCVCVCECCVVVVVVCLCVLCRCVCVFVGGGVRACVRVVCVCARARTHCILDLKKVPIIQTWTCASNQYGYQLIAVTEPVRICLCQFHRKHTVSLLIWSLHFDSINLLNIIHPQSPPPPPPHRFMTVSHSWGLTSRATSYSWLGTGGSRGMGTYILPPTRYSVTTRMTLH